MHLDVCLIMLKCVLVGLNWVLPMMYLFLHVTCSCIFHAYISSLFSLFSYVCDVFSFSLPLSLSLSLSRIDCAWHLSTNLLRLGTLLVLGLLLLLIHPLFKFDFVMGRPTRTSLRTFKDGVFIQSTMSFYQTFQTLLYPVSFKLGDENLFVRYL